MLVVVGLIVYPILSVLAGHHYPALPTFGLPCPTTIYTLGLLLWFERLPRSAAVIPAFWAVIGTFAALQLGVPEDFLLIASLLGSAVAITGRRIRQPEKLAVAPPEDA